MEVVPNARITPCHSTRAASRPYSWRPSNRKPPPIASPSSIANARPTKSCGARVEALLIAHDQPDSLLDRLFVAPTEQITAILVLQAERADEVDAAGQPVAATIDHVPATDGGPVPVATAGNHIPRSLAEGPGSRIGPYKLLQLIGEGGMGSVYMAEQEKPVRRRVAPQDHQAGHG